MDNTTLTPKLYPQTIGNLSAVKSRSDRQTYLSLITSEAETQEYLESLPIEVAEKIQKKQAKSAVKTHGPIVCQGPSKCPFHSLCPLAEVTSTGEVLEASLEYYPISRPCLLEDQYIRYQLAEYIVRFDIDHDDPVDMSIIRELALLDLQKQRALNILSVGDKEGQGRDFMRVETHVAGITPQGQVLENSTAFIHPIYQFIEQIENRRMKWYNKLIATRKDQLDMQVKLGKKEETLSANTIILELREALKGHRAPQPMKVLSLED